MRHMENLGQIGLDLVVNKKDFSRQISSIMGLAKKAGAALAGAFATKKLVDFGKSCIELGSDLAEVQNVVDVTFPHMTNQVDTFAKAAKTSYGLSETMAKQYTGTFGAMAKAFGFSEQAAYDMGSTLTALSGDVASFYNLSNDEAYTKLKSVFTGETESLKDLGVVMTQTSLDSYALANGFGKTTAKMSEAEKVALRYSFVQNQLAASSGDFARTSGGWANQIRILRLQLDSLKATIGQGLIAAFTPILKMINLLLQKLATLASAFKAFMQLITGTKDDDSGGIGGLTAAAAEATSGLTDASGAAESLESATSGVGSAAKKAAKQMKALMGFDEVNRLDAPESDSGSSDDPGGGNTVPSIGAAVDFGSLSAGDTVLDGLEEKFQKLQYAIEPTTTALKNLWNQGLAKLGEFSGKALSDFYKHFLKPVGKWTLGTGIPRFVNALNDGLMKVNWDKLNEGLKNLWDALAPFAIRIGEGLLWFWENVLVPLGTWTANNVVPAFLQTLTNVLSACNGILVGITPLFEAFWDVVLKPLAQWTGGLFIAAWETINNLLGAFANYCAEEPGTILLCATAVSTFFAAWEITKILSWIQMSGGLVGILGSLKSALEAVTFAKIKDKIETMYLVSLHAQDFVTSIEQTITALAKQAIEFAKNTAAKIADKAAQLAMTAATAAWNAVCQLATAATTAFGEVLTFLTSPIGLVVVAITAAIAIGVLLWKNWDTLSAKAKVVWEYIRQIFERFQNWLDGIFAKDWSKQFGAFGEILNAFFANAKNIFSGLKTLFSGIIDFIKGVFTGNWRQAWTGVKNIFKGIWDTFKGIVQSPINAIIGMINGLLRGVQTMENGIAGALNKIHIDLPGWLQDMTGMTSFGFNVPTWSAPQIPYLSQGGYVKPNTPQLAMIGDNRHQGEIVAPENKLLEMARIAASESGNAALLQQVIKLLETLISLVQDGNDIVLNVDGEELARAMMNGSLRLKRRFTTIEVSI